MNTNILENLNLHRINVFFIFVVWLYVRLILLDLFTYLVICIYGNQCLDVVATVEWNNKIKKIIQ